MTENKDSSLCPVKSYEKLLSKLHPENKRVWQRPRDTFCDNDSVWYTKQGLGKDSISSFMTKLSKACCLSKIYTNHSIRATGITALFKNKFADSLIMAVTGHKSVNSLAVYHRVSNQKKGRSGPSHSEFNSTFNYTSTAGQYDVTVNFRGKNGLETPKSTIIAFYAYMSKPITNPSSGRRLIFDVLTTNQGSGYNSHTGVFTSPKTGTYVFVLVVRLYSALHSIQLMINNSVYGTTFLNAKNADSTVSSTAVANVSKGDTNKEYVIKNNKCTTLNYTTSVELACIPMGFKILSRSYVGSGMTKLNATLYKYMDITGTRFYFEVVDDGCIPLMTDTASPNWLGEGSKICLTLYPVMLQREVRKQQLLTWESAKESRTLPYSTYQLFV
ncbi:unnamed protein product [Mytilus coruscus]|uniref:C1q domain-containing protein n=1 Tax=Mytilus coruscus TaxID=42192 RepID=A0A6J8ANR9_MYTCO|nr:unnamed protein product [Mytilus coruscus]